jgi:hypothetical protein
VAVSVRSTASASRLYVYKLTTDNGGAPHVRRGLLSLAICKPSIRRTAQENDWIFGFGGQELGERLIYIARVTKRLACGSYYVEPQYTGRGDRIYRLEAGRFVLRKGARYHSRGDQVKRDLGTWPRYDRVNVLLSADFRYWGRSGTTEYRARFPQIVTLLRRLGQGHRVNVSEGRRAELIALQQGEWRRYSTRRTLGAPTQNTHREVCNDSEGPVTSSIGAHKRDSA